MPRSSSNDALTLISSLRSAYAATPTNLKIIDLYVCFSVATALIQVVYVAIVGTFPFNSFLSGALSCVGTAVLAGKWVVYWSNNPDLKKKIFCSLFKDSSEQRKQRV